jgi:hypothetical protein
MKNRLREIILHYLKSTENYLYFTNNLDSAQNFIVKNSRIYTLAKDSIDRLKPSLCYLIEKHMSHKNYLKNEINVKIMNFKNAKSFRTHDYKLIMNVEREAGKYIFSKYMGSDSLVDNQILETTVAHLFLEFSGEISIDDSSLIQYFKDKSTDQYITIDELYEISKNIMIDSNKNEMNTLLNYAKNLQPIFKNFQEQGLFVKVDIVHNIYRNEFSLFEINQFSLTKSINEIRENKKSANSMFNTNYITLDNYIDRTTNNYSDNVCYFNPFILEKKKFMQSYLRLVDKFERTDKTQDMKYKFLYLLSNIQYIVTDLQQYNLHCDLMIGQKVSFSSFIKESIDNYKRYADLSDIDKIETLLYLEYINEYIDKNKLKNYSNISIENIGCSRFNEKSKIKAEKILNRILTGMLKTKEYTLMKMHKIFTSTLIEILKEQHIKADKDDKTFLKEIVMYLIFEDLNFHKLDNTTYYNDKFKETYDYYKNKNIHDRLVACDLQNI